MKKYEHVRMKYKLWDGEYIHKDETGKSTYREIIKIMPKEVTDLQEQSL